MGGGGCSWRERGYPGSQRRNKKKGENKRTLEDGPKQAATTWDRHDFWVHTMLIPVR